MPRVILKCPYIKSGTKQGAAHLKHYVRYMATRDGAELVSQRQNYLEYIAQRPRVQKLGAHGLFTSSNDALVLTQVAEAVANHPGNVWLPIISLRREDAVRLGYDSAASWQALLSGFAPEMASAMKIPPEQFRWYAAFHDEGDHPHVHMVCYSADGKSGYLTQAGIEKIKSGLARQIFRQELTEVYVQQTQRRDELTREAGDALRRLARELQAGTLEDQRVQQLLVYLAEQLKTTSGKKQYGYLKPALKAVVDEVVDELEKDARVAQAYRLWYELRKEVLRTYQDAVPEPPPLSQQKEFRRVKNLVVQEAVRLGEQLDGQLGGQKASKPERDASPQPDPVEAPAPSTTDVLPAVRSATRLIRQVGGLFESQAPAHGTGVRFTDRKLLRKIQEKKLAQGHKADDHAPKLNS
jgi:hypothetical protein